MMFDGLSRPSFGIHDVSKIIQDKTQAGQSAIEHFLSADVQAELADEEVAYLNARKEYVNLEPRSNIQVLSNSDAIHVYNGAFTRHVRGVLFKDYLGTRCPICGNYYSDSTLDHVLPKTRYTQYAVTPINLVPMCFSCNKAKGKSDISFHPYFQNLSQLEGLKFEFNFNQLNVVSVTCSQDELARYLRIYKMDKKLEYDANELLKGIMSKILKVVNKMPSRHKISHTIELQKDAINIVPWERIFYDDLLCVIGRFYDELCLDFKHK